MMECKWAHVAINNERLKVSRFADLNDPFELLGMNRHTKQARHLSKGFREHYDVTRGLLCFAADWSSPVMWSHYAEKHKGICLGFDVRRTLVDEVSYEDQRLRIALGETADPLRLPGNLQKLLFLTKARPWSYEDEWRMLIDLRHAVKEGRLYFQPFSDDFSLAEVILGAGCAESHESLRRLLAAKSSTAVAFRARMAYRSFRVVLNGNTRPAGSPIS
jgi:hypothetical protein